MTENICKITFTLKTTFPHGPLISELDNMRVCQAAGPVYRTAMDIMLSPVMEVELSPVMEVETPSLVMT